jgi:hypothetical protein
MQRIRRKSAGQANSSLHKGVCPSLKRAAGSNKGINIKCFNGIGK